MKRLSARILIGLFFMMSSLLYGSAQEFLYSINLPANPFQQPYFQMMVKSDNPNQVTNVKTLVQIPYAGNEQINIQNVAVTTDYVSYYTDGTNGSIATVVYGLTPYVVRGYVEGIASTLYLQRPAQITLPFIPAGCSNVQATFPDYMDAFLTQTAASVERKFGKFDWKKKYGLSGDTPMGAWFRYYPCILSWSAAGGHCHHYSDSFATGGMGFGTLSFQAENTQHFFSPLFQLSGANYWPQNCSWSPYMPSSANTVGGNLLTSVARYGSYSGHLNILSCSPIVYAIGNFAGNFSQENNLYSSIPTTLYGSSQSLSTTSYAQLFEENMQFFIGTPPSTATPGQGIFSDAIQIAGMEAVSSIMKASVFLGSNGVSAITGPLMLSGSYNQTNSFTVPEAFLSKMTANNFVSSIYFSNAQTGWTGALGPQESAFEYYTGVVLNTDNPTPYFPFYLLEPGAIIGQPGTNYCSQGDFQEMQLNQSTAQQMHVSEANNPMVNLLDCLSGTRQHR